MAKIEILESGYVAIACPGCKTKHILGVASPAKLIWEWNNSLDSPTFSPSLKVTGVVPLTDEQIDQIRTGTKIEPIPFICHSLIKDGMIEFCSDTTHELSGKTVELGDV